MGSCCSFRQENPRVIKYCYEKQKKKHIKMATSFLILILFSLIHFFFHFLINGNAKNTKKREAKPLKRHIKGFSWKFLHCLLYSGIGIYVLFFFSPLRSPHMSARTLWVEGWWNVNKWRDYICRMNSWKRRDVGWSEKERIEANGAALQPQLQSMYIFCVWFRCASVEWESEKLREKRNVY